MTNHPITLSAIVAMSLNRVIGIHNQLPWHLPADLKHFKALTSGHAILMGRKTYESIGKPLPNRLNLILTRQLNYQAPGCHVVHTIEEALALALAHQHTALFIIGGAEIYTQLLPKIDKLYLTIVNATIEGDTYFPLLNETDWREIERISHAADEAHHYDYSFVEWERA